VGSCANEESIVMELFEDVESVESVLFRLVGKLDGGGEREEEMVASAWWRRCVGDGGVPENVLRLVGEPARREALVRGGVDESWAGAESDVILSGAGLGAKVEALTMEWPLISGCLGRASCVLETE
jgi:hypothetical protein